jgi:hypothetical protein
VHNIALSTFTKFRSARCTAVVATRTAPKIIFSRHPPRAADKMSVSLCLSVTNALSLLSPRSATFHVPRDERQQPHFRRRLLQQHETPITKDHGFSFFSWRREMPSQTEPIRRRKSRTGIVEMRRVRHRLALVKAQFGREGVNNPSNSCRSRRLRERGAGAAANNYLACERRETAMERRKWRKARLESPVICLRPLVVDPESPVICLRPAVVDLSRLSVIGLGRRVILASDDVVC